MCVAGDKMMISSNLQFISSDGFYPSSLKFTSNIKMENQLYKISIVSFENEDFELLPLGQNLQFSQDLIIQHQKSNRYLSAIMQSDNLVLALTEQRDRRCLFRFLPCYKSQVQNSNSINYADDVYLQFSPENDAYTEGLIMDSIDLYVNRLNKELCLSNQKNTIFQLKQIQSPIHKPIQYGDFIQIKSIESESFLSLIPHQNNLIDIQSQSEVIYNNIWNNCWNKKNTQNIWRIYHPHNHMSALNNVFYLRHFSTNLYYKDFELTSQLKEATLLTIEEVHQSNSTLYLLKCVSNGKIISFIPQNQIDLIKQDVLQLQFKEQSSKLDLLQFDVIKSFDMQEQAWLDSVVKLLKKTINYFQTNKQMIMQFIFQEATQFKAEDFYILLSEIEICLRDMIFFCSFDMDKNTIINRDSLKYLKPNQQHQDLLREKRILQLVMQLIDVINWNQDCTQMLEQSQKQKNESQTLVMLKDTLQLTFLFVEVFASHHDLNSQMVFASYFRLKAYFGLGIGAFYAYIRLFQQNQELIPLAGITSLTPDGMVQEFALIKRQTRITTSVVKNQNLSATLIDDMFTLASNGFKMHGIRYWSNVLKLLCTLCLSNGNACFNNQMMIGRQLLLKNIVIEIKIKNDLIFVPVHDDVEINELYQQSWRAGESIIKQIQVFQSFLDNQLNLIGLTCQERNYENIQKFRQILPQSILIKYVNNYRNHEVLRCRLITILMNLYVDCYPYQAKPSPKLIIKKLKIQRTSEKNVMEMQEIFTYQKQVFSQDEIYAVRKLLDITSEILRTMLIQQGAVNLIPSVWKMLTMYYKLYTFNLPEQNLDLLLEAISVLPSSLPQKEPSQEMYQEYQQFQQQKETFNQIAQVLIDFFLYFTRKHENKQVLIIMEGQEIQQVGLKNLTESLIGLIAHNQTLAETKLKAWQLLLEYCQPKRCIIKRMKHYLFLENQTDIKIYYKLKETKRQLLQLESVEDKLPFYQKCITSLEEFNLFESDCLIQRQTMFRLLELDTLLLEFLDSYSQVCYLVTQKYIRSCRDDRYLLQTSPEEDLIVKFCRVSLEILKQFIHINFKNKKRLVKKFSKIDDLMRCLDIGQYALFIELYDNSPELASQASPKFIQILIENGGIPSIGVLEALIYQQQKQLPKNVEQIAVLLQNGSNLQRLFGTTEYKFHTAYRIIHSVGHVPYLQQAKAADLICNLFQHNNSQQMLSKVFQDYFPAAKVMKWIIELRGLEQENLDLGILEECLRNSLMKLLKMLVQHRGSLVNEEQFQQLVGLFLEVELGKMSRHQQGDLRLEDFHKLEHKKADEKYRFLEKYYGRSENGEEQKSESDSLSEEEEEVDEKEQRHNISLYCLEGRFLELNSSKQSIELLGLILSLGQVTLEQIAVIEDNNTKNQSRSTSMVARQLSISQNDNNNGSFEVLNNQKLKQLYELKQKICKFLLFLEEYLKIHLSKFDIQDNTTYILECQLVFHMIFQRRMELASQVLNINKGKQFDAYSNPNFIYDKRIIEKVRIQKLQPSPYLDQQINLLMNYSLLEERYLFIQILLKYEIIQPLMHSLQYAIQNLGRFYKVSIQCMEIIQHLIDLHGLVDSSYEQSRIMYLNLGQNQTKSQELILQRNLTQLQNSIVNSGFYQIFISFCSNRDRIKLASYSEYDHYNVLRKDGLQYQFLLTIIKLVKGYESANNYAQRKLYEEIQLQGNNDILHYFQANFLNTQPIVFELERILLSYQFSEKHIYESDRQREGIMNLQLRLMQLLAEDHFRPFQDFFREQTGFLKNYDILESLVSMLQQQFSQETFQQISHDEYETILNCFDCVKELIQGPCPLNQERICQTPFLRLCLKLLNYDDSQGKFLEQYKNEEPRGRQLTINQSQRISQIQDKTNIQQNIISFYTLNPSYCQLLVESFRRSNPLNFRLYMLSQIKYRCATTLESLTDSDQQDNENIRRIASIISEQLLIKNITIKYEKFKILYGSGKNYNNFVFTHLNGIPPNFNIKQKKHTQKQINRDNFLIQETLLASQQVQEEVSNITALQDFWLSFIIETGFSLFVLLAQIYQLKEVNVLERIYEQISNNKTKKKKLQDIFFYQLFKFLFQASSLSKNLVDDNDSQKMSDKIFKKYKIKKAPGEQEAQLKKLGYRALRFFATRTGSLEILLPNKVMKKVIFPLMPHCFVLEETIKGKFTNQIDRLSQQTKVESVLYLSANVIHKLKTEYQFQNLSKQSVVVNLLASNHMLWKQIIFVIIVLENLLILLSSNGHPDPIMDEVVFILNCIQISIQFLCFFIFIVKKLPYLQAKAREEVQEKQINRIKTREIKYKYLETQQQQPDNYADNLLLEQNKYRRLYYYIIDSLVLYKNIFFDYEMIYFIIFSTFGIVGLFYRIVLAALLLDVFWRFPTLTSIINSIWRPKNQILLVLALFIIMQYYYSLIVYNYYAQDYYPVCQNLLQCFSFIFDVTFKTDGGVVGYFLTSEQSQTAYQNPSFRFGVKNLLEFIYVFVVISLLYSIITGIIIDTFGVLRDEAQDLDDDIQGFCLICGIDRGTIEKKAKHKKGFKFHVKHEHSVWNYIFYISYLEDKKKSEFNGIESIVESELRAESIAWFPIGKALSIAEDSDTKEEYNSLKNMLNERLSGIENQLKIIL